MVLLWRLGLGRFINISPRYGGRIMVLSHRGRKSGRLLHTPVNYAEVDGAIYCVAGFGAKTHWYRNLVADPNVEIWLPDGWWKGTAVDMAHAPRRLDLIRKVLIASGFAARFAGIDPRSCDDATLAQLTADYRLVRVDRNQPLAGAGGPGDLRWVWFSLLAAAVLLFVRRTQRR
jgi:deazaflavin-dependent oxidoreductase (nitroreductase family)